MVSGNIGGGRIGGALSAASVGGGLSAASVVGSVGAAGVVGAMSAAALSGALAAASVSGEVVAGGDAVMPPSFAGPYEADARFIAQTIPTRMRYMEQDFEVHAINYTEAPNDGGGFTVTIGG